MPSLPIRWIHGRTYCQATEDEPGVEAALELAVPGAATTVHRLTGQYGNPVAILSRRLDSSEALRAAWARWLASGVVPALRPEIDARVDEDAVLHFRLDKQEAAQGRLVLLREGDAIDVQVKVKAYPATPAEIHRVARALVSGAV